MELKRTAEAGVETDGKTACIIVERDGENDRGIWAFYGWSGVHRDSLVITG
jgi:hypothetical protein